MNLTELGIIVFEAQKGNWEEKDFEHFIWRVTQMLDHNVNEDDLENFRPDVKWIDKSTEKEAK